MNNAGRLATLRGAFVALTWCALALASAASGEADPIGSVIDQAGRTSSDVERYELLAQLRQQSGLPAELVADLERLLPIARQYAAIDRQPTVPGDGVRGAENGYLCFFYSSIRRTKDTPSSDYPPSLHADSPLFPLYCFYRGRMLVWYPIQRGSIAEDPEKRAPWFDEGRRLLRISQEAYPSNPVIGMYLDAPILWPDPAAPDPAAPEWANLQRNILEKWADVVEWWIDHRQLPNGEFGGGWGDDVELWRTWAPVLVAFKDPKIEAAQQRISEGIFRMPHMRAGFMQQVHDAEHAAEDSADSITPMLLIRPEVDTIWMTRARRLGELMREVWTGTNARGALQFMSSYIGAEGIDRQPDRACDTVYHFRSMQPALLAWQQTRDPELTALFTRWIDTWVEATMRAENGKPAGIPPAAIRWPDGTAGGTGADWIRAGFYDTGLYDFPAAIDEMLPNFLLAHHVTGETKYLEPIITLARLQQRLRAGELGSETRGSLAWCVRQTGRAVAAVLPKYRVLTGDASFDDLIAAADGYASFRLFGNEDGLLRELRQTSDTMKFNFEAYTSEVRWTDRIQAFHRKYADFYGPRKTPGLALVTVYESASGDLGMPAYFPMRGVRWLTPPRQVAALVRRSSQEGFTAELFHFGEDARSMGAELYQLARGPHTATLDAIPTGAGERRRLGEWRIDADGSVTKFDFALPPRVRCVVHIQPE